MMNQREAVFTVVTNVLGSRFKGKVTMDDLSSSDKDLITELLVNDFMAGLVSLRDESKRNVEYLKGYVPGLLNNWVRKDENLNGNVKYVAKRPGSRTGSGDEMLASMKALLAMKTDPTERALIQTEIDKRISELKPKPTINLALLPAHLQAMVNNKG